MLRFIALIDFELMLRNYYFFNEKEFANNRKK